MKTDSWYVNIGIFKCKLRKMRNFSRVRLKCKKCGMLEVNFFSRRRQYKVRLKKMKIMRYCGYAGLMNSFRRDVVGVYDNVRFA